MKVLITGMGIITPLGVSLEENRKSFSEGKSGLSRLELFPTKYAKELFFGEIKIPTDDLKLELNVKEESVTRTALLAEYAMRQALQMSDWSPEEITAESTALISANSVGGMCLTDEFYTDANSKSSTSPYLTSYDNGSVNLYLQKKYGIGGIVNTINTACSSSTNAISYGARLIKNGLADRAIVGGTDSLAKFTINGFNALTILSDEKCRPFDSKRKGLNLGEGAAFLLLEKEDLVGQRKVYGEVSGYANTNDAYHPSTLSPEGNGPYEAMKQALALANLSTNDIGYINAHGTGTVNNDEVEGVAMKRLFGAVPEFSSNKSAIGHTLGASGAIEAVMSLLSLNHQEIYPSQNFDQPEVKTQLKPITQYKKTELKHVMSNSFGFGGNCSSIIFTKV